VNQRVREDTAAIRAILDEHGLGIDPSAE